MQGAVASIAQSTVTVTTKTGPSRVDITAATKVSQVTPVDLRAVVVGSCVAISHGVSAPGAPPAPANTITVSTAPASGKCKQFHDEKTATGAVTAVNGPSVLVADTDGAPTTVPVGDKTKFQRRDNTSALAITPGSCLKASGTQVNDGVLQVVSATVSTPPAPGKCPGVK
ncbi:hypothetical protein MSZK_31000 [Mycobacterium sp. shizuoka-1]|nr:hypothetical protein MSZK_31000 [Mycobacterium sp. shizuoka-1]